jgi:hypothetical protein
LLAPRREPYRENEMTAKTSTRRKPTRDNTRRKSAARGRRSGAVADRGVYGEGNYQASREYNDATREFVESGRVDEAARRAAPASGREQASLEEAERVGKRRAKGEDPQLAPPRARR